MENEESNNLKNLSQEQKTEVINSWFDNYNIVKIVIKRPDYVIFLEE